ncbi:MAG: hypothetical protein PUF72_06200 [Clostridiales bacterium]|nr:hypothetical protein [Clostridiales bacterium]
MKNKKLIAAIGAVSGLCILSTAALANYQTSNGYDILKKALLSVYKYENCTIETNAAMTADSEEIAGTYCRIEYDMPSKQKYIQNSNSESGVDVYFSEEYQQDGKIYYSQPGSDYFSYEHDFLDTVFDVSLEEYTSKSTQKMLRFAELLGDTVVGDLKNNFICVGDSDGQRSYEVSLSSVQIPELINAGLGAMFSIENNNSRYIENYEPNRTEQAINNLWDNQRVYTINCRYSVDKDNMLTDLEGTIIFKGTDQTGAEHDMTVFISTKFSDIGTTSPKHLDTSKVKITDAEVYNAEETEESED